MSERDTIWKFPLFDWMRTPGAYIAGDVLGPPVVTETVEIEMPKGAIPLHVATQGQMPCLWAAVDPTAEPEKRRFVVRATGKPLGFDRLSTAYWYTGSFQMFEETASPLIFHLFEVRP